MVSIPDPKPKPVKMMKQKEEKAILLRLRGDDIRRFKELREHYPNEEQQEVILYGVRLLHEAMIEKKAASKKSSK